MRRVLLIAASGLALAACSGSMPSFEMPSFQAAPAASTIEFESEPAGADVKTSTGQACRTPCSLSVAANDFTATFSLNGYQTASMPVRMSQSTEGRDPNTGQVPPPRMTPNPVYVELTLAPPVRRAPTPPPATRPTAKKKPKPQPPKTPAAADPTMSAPPAAASPPPSSPWPAPVPAR